jgi:inosine-uridine nucleoside N-ribohydrolase
MPQTCRMILDVDTGIDDAMAILYALARPGISLEALTTTFGNTDVDTAAANTLRILELAARAEFPSRAARVGRCCARSSRAPIMCMAPMVSAMSFCRRRKPTPSPNMRPI